MRILHTADWHLDAPFTAFAGSRREMLREQQRQLPWKIAELCRENECHMMLLAGDIFDGKPSRETVENLKNALTQCGVPVLISPGNHDFCCTGSPWTEESWPENVHVFTEKIESVVFPHLNCRVYGAGYRSMDCLSLLDGFHAGGEEKWQIGLFHADPLNRNSPCSPITMGQIRTCGLSYLALGHIHKAQLIRGGRTLCAWPGCPMGRGWDETGEKGVCIVTLEEEASVRFLPLDVPRFYDLTVEVQEDAKTALEQTLPAAGSGDFYRVTLTGPSAEQADDLSDFLRDFPNLILRDRRERNVDLWEQMPEDSLLGIYFRKLREKYPEDPAAEEAVRLSRRILSGGEVKLP